MWQDLVSLPCLLSTICNKLHVFGVGESSPTQSHAVCPPHPKAHRVPTRGLPTCPSFPSFLLLKIVPLAPVDGNNQ